MNCRGRETCARDDEFVNWRKVRDLFACVDRENFRCTYEARLDERQRQVPRGFTQQPVDIQFYSALIRNSRARIEQPFAVSPKQRGAHHVRDLSAAELL